MWLIFFLKVTLSSITFYYLSQFLIVLIHFMENGEPLFIPSQFLILTQRKNFGSSLCALSESLSQFKWVFKTLVSFYIVYQFIFLNFYHIQIQLQEKNTLETNHFPKNQLGNLYDYFIKIITILKTKTTKISKYHDLNLRTIIFSC